jgi:cytochrome b561
MENGNVQKYDQTTEWHGLAANILLGLATLHAAAALLHHYVMKDTVFSRMLPWRTVLRALN